MNSFKNYYRKMGIIVALGLILTLAGCASDTETPQPTATKTTASGSVTADGTGLVSASTPVSSPLGNSLTIQANTLLSEDAAGAYPVAGDIATTVSYSKTAADLPAAALTLPVGASLAAFLDIHLGDVNFFSKPLKANVNVISGGASVGDIVAFYTFNPVLEAWEPVDNATVAADGTAPLSIRHLSVYAAFKTATPPPGKPSDTSATPGNTSVIVSWSAPKVGPAPTSYNLYYATDPGISTTSGIRLESVESPYELTGLVNGTPYYFAVTAVNENVEGGFSSEETATPDISLQPPASPNGVTATAGSGSVVIQWNTKLYATAYNIYYLASDSITTVDLLATGLIETVASEADPQPTTQSVEITGLTAGTVYSFVVTAENASGESAAQSNPRRVAPN